MKTYHLIGHDGSVRPGKASTEQIAQALEATQSYEDRLCIVDLRDGEVVATRLSDSDIAQLRNQLNEYRATELRTLLGHLLAAARLADKMSSVSNPSITIFVESHPWAEDVVRDWAASNSLNIDDRPMPAKGVTWIRTCDVRISDRSWASSLVTLQWPSQRIDGAAIVARDAELDGRHDDAIAAMEAF